MNAFDKVSSDAVRALMMYNISEVWHFNTLLTRIFAICKFMKNAFGFRTSRIFDRGFG